MHHAEGSYACRVRGCHDGDHCLGDDAIDLVAEAWAAAGNAVRWLPHSGRIPRT